MNIRPIRNDDDLKAVFHRLESIFQAEEQTRRPMSVTCW
jgi:HTH-type transcriptional regulator/antitoxin HigA